MRNGNRCDEWRKERKVCSLWTIFSKWLCAEKAIVGYKFFEADKNGARSLPIFGAGLLGWEHATDNRNSSGK